MKFSYLELTPLFKTLQKVSGKSMKRTLKKLLDGPALVFSALGTSAHYMVEVSRAHGR